MVETWYRVAVLSIGGVLGVNARFWLGVAINRWAGSQFPWATFTINITGSFAIGLCTAVLARWLPHPHVRLLVDRRVPRGLHDVLVLFNRIIDAVGARRARSLPCLPARKCRCGFCGGRPRHHPRSRPPAA